MCTLIGKQHWLNNFSWYRKIECFGFDIHLNDRLTGLIVISKSVLTERLPQKRIALWTTKYQLDIVDSFFHTLGL